MAEQGDRLDVTRHWLATRQGAGYVAVPRTAEDADDYRAQGWTVRGPFVLEAQQASGAVDEAAERIFQSGILDDIAGSNGGEGRDAMQDAVKIARLALGGQ